MIQEFILFTYVIAGITLIVWSLGGSFFVYFAGKLFQSTGLFK